MEAIEKTRDSALAAVTQARIEIVNSAPPAAQPSLLVNRGCLFEVARFFRENPRYQMDFCSCVTAVDYPPKDAQPGYIEVVYHLYSVALKHGPIILKVRAPRAVEDCTVPSLTPLWRGCEFQEREAYD